MSEQHVQGAAQVAKMLEELPAEMRRKIVRQALRDGAKVVLERAKQIVPRGRTGRLAAALRVSTSAKGGALHATVKFGDTKKGGVYYGRFVEGGTKAHTISVRKAKDLAIGGAGARIILRKKVEHPGAQASNFMRDAMSAVPQALEVIVAQAKARIETWWAKQGKA